jgi:hypothetical protein
MKKAAPKCGFFMCRELQPVHNNVETKPYYVNKVPVPSSALECKMMVSSEVTFHYTI